METLWPKTPQRHRSRLRRVAGQIADDLADPFVIEDRWHVSRRGEHRQPITHSQRIRVVDLESIAVDHRDRERPEWSPVFEGPDRAAERVSVHCCSSLATSVFE